MLRTRTCGDLRKADVESSVTLCGWVENYRDHGGLVFIDLRDRYGLTQVVFNPDFDPKMHATARDLRAEDVIQVSGDVVARGEGLINPKLATGEIEVRARSLNVLNKSLTPPFEPNSQNLPNEELRLKYRFVDLRRKRLQEAVKLRHKLMKVTRDYFDALEFLEIETPILGRSTPEGARDYLVPSRVHEGCFYALPQSPQIYKQILMVAGYDRYFQIARCFRDEDLRADRQPEFTQIDLEMAFVEREDILTVIDGLVAAMYQAVRGIALPTPLPRFTYADVMERFGSDKPDMRFGMELNDIGEIAKDCGFGVFNKTIESGGRVRGLNAKGAAEKYSRKNIDELTAWVGDYGAKGLAFFRVKEEDGGLKLDSPIAKFFEPEHQKAIIDKLEGEAGDLLFFVADKGSVTSAALGALRVRLGKELELYGPDDFDCHWVLDFPLVAWNDDEQRWDAEHHPFCAIVDEDLPLMESDPGKVRAASYDLVCNGYEAASGSVRIHDPKVQQQVFDMIGITAEEAEERFSFLLEALRYGAPPHAGIALGMDRWLMIFSGIDNIREVIAFPKTQKASDLMSGAPSEVDSQQLRDLYLKIDIPGQSGK
ncbi:aspartate--tRNA ligase [Calycomorphotria hydatis]|uniref:Aspartate--tRNA(Asp/Asn) ligase n=1 Tax=Calycomorphotria hydatis TaxID=2528027 RepID=A0A517T440_9PLAN|nr:aspartate--tRNA ligase [Calycomorphotria hydatis]QDT63121.1 Aspartate--tRNA ligase [Calycomorphotria hydatis]